jgi:hypothetical protein
LTVSELVSNINTGYIAYRLFLLYVEVVLNGELSLLLLEEASVVWRDSTREHFYYSPD